MRQVRFSLQSRLLCGAATGFAMLAAATPAVAQDAAATTEEDGEIVVSGIRAAIENSLEAKRDSAGIIEVISAEDIGKLPDLSIADSLARLPGVTAQRVRGRSQQISIRGLGPDFSLALLNGREVVSSGNNRGIEFDQFPSELIGQGVVYKTPDASLAASGIAGSVDLRTIRPLDYKEALVNVSARFVYNDSGKLNPDFDDKGYRLFASYIDQNDDGTVGWYLGATHQSNPTHFISRELKTSDTRDPADRTNLTGQVRRTADGVFYPFDNPRQGVVSREFERTSIAGALQFEPMDTFSLTVDAFWSDQKDSGIFRGTETPIASWSGATFGSATGSGPFADSATYNAVVPIVRTDTEGNESNIFAIGTNAEWEFADNLTLTLDYGYSRLDRDDIDYESYAGTGFNRSGPQDTLTFTFPKNGEYSIDTNLDYTDPGVLLLTDPGGWGQVGFIKQPKINDELHQLRAELEYEFDTNFVRSIQVGYLMTDRSKDFDSNENFLRASSRFVNGSLTIPAGARVGVTDTGSLGMPILAYDPASLLTDGTYVLQKANDTQWVVDEKVDNAYAMLNLDADLGGMAMKGNVGVRYAKTRQRSLGTVSGGVNDVSDSFENWMPSANLAFEVMEDTFVKVAFAKSITRARLDQLAANQNVTFDSTICADTNSDGRPDTLVADFDPDNRPCFFLGGGNPNLRPYKSTSYDISFEKYFSRGTALAVAVFHKDLSDWIVDVGRPVDLTRELPLAGFGAFFNANPEVAQGRQNGPLNFSDGKITGIEGTLRLDFVDLSSGLEGLGAAFSYTYADASIDDAAGNSLNIPGYSENVWSAEAFYEKNGFQTKVSARHRSGFLSEVQNFDGSLSGADAQSETIIDAQIGYTFEDRDDALNGFGIQFEVFNLTNEPFVTQNDLFNAAGTEVIGTHPSRHEVYGRTYNVTLKKAF